MSNDGPEVLLADDPLGRSLLTADVAPRAACVAAARWLCAAARVTSQVAGAGAVGVFAEAADEFGVGEWQTMELVVGRILDDEVTGAEVVDELVRTGHDERALLTILLDGIDACRQVYGIYADDEDAEERPDEEIAAEFAAKLRAEATIGV